MQTRLSRYERLKMITMLLLLPVATMCPTLPLRAETKPATRPSTRAIRLLKDPDFRRGFKVYDPSPGKHVIRGTIQVDPRRGKPLWGLTQWSSRFTLADATPERLDSGAVRFADTAKAVTFGPASGPERGMIFALNARREYGNRFRRPDEPWAHLLAEQRFARHPTIVALARLRFHIRYRLRYANAGSSSDKNAPGQAAQFLAYLTVQNLNPKSQGRGDYLWFGVQMYDSRYPVPKLHAALDAGTGKFIYNPEGSVYSKHSAHSGTWVTIDRDLLPLIHEGLQTAWKHGHLRQSRDLADFRLGGFNIGWELPGTLDVELQFQDLQIEAVLKQPFKAD